MSANQPSNAEILQAVQKVSERVGKIETALYGTGNPHGGLFGKFEALDGKVTALDAKFEGKFTALSSEIKGVEKTLTAKFEGMDKNFDKMFSFARWVIGGLAGTICVAIILPIIQKWIEN